MAYLFTYGTLRPGGALDYWLQGPGVEVYAPKAELLGYTMYQSNYGNHPVIRRGPGSVKGVIYKLMAYSSTFENVVSMEVRAGYHAEWHESPGNLLINGKVLDYSAYFEFLVFTWPEYEQVGKQVRSGDWFAREEGS
jgi:gamma-glutamylcyclotransferase (GGCT)/AIG2-like uncharacterized protein YtfP